MRKTAVLILVICVRCAFGQPGQLNIPRVELMPAQPSPYAMRDWREVAIGYDSFVYDRARTGQYLPLCFLNPAGVNYPEIGTFRLHTYVGTNSPFGNEAINVLPSLVGASLVGIDKRDQFGQDWIRMSRDFFNKANGENIYLNAPGATSGNDWWYDMMPNVYFYQLYDLYPDQDAEIDWQFTTVADRMAEAVQAMGGREAPWSPAYMNYRAWRFSEMEPNANGVPEPEAAGAYAWLLYHAWKTTGNDHYRKAAEWSLEFLDGWTTNPSYELMLPYGTLVAAKMNAELGTNYDIEKMINWSFNRGPLRGWGTIVGTWGGLNVSGLVGEANDAGNDYAFQLNGVQQAAALAPMVRYDKRYARAVAKWILNLANATRLFYPSFLPADQQDASGWSTVHDPENVMGYEALRQVWQGKSPFSTGDAVNGGWAATNLALYGTSSIGYLGALIAPTNVDRILRINVLATDFFRDEAYPTYLYYNSYASPRSVQLQTGSTPVDVYDALTGIFIHKDVTGIVALSIPAGQAMLVTLCPAGGTITYDRNRMLVNGVVVDYRQSAQPYTAAPRIKGLAALENPIEVNGATQIMATATDSDSGTLTYAWSAAGGTLEGEGDNVAFMAPAAPGEHEVTCIVSDPDGNTDTATVILRVVAEINDAPQVHDIAKDVPYTGPGGTVTLTCLATDPDNDVLAYTWVVSGGLITGSGETVEWMAPGAEGIYGVTVTATDEGGLTGQLQRSLLVHVFDTGESDIIAHYPFTGNADDVSGNALHGVPSGAQLTADRFGNPAQAYLFNGGSNNIAVANSPLLNVQDAISVACWFDARALPDRETFIVSHGSWQNRWKISVTPDGRLRWTVNTLAAIGDLDALVPLAVDSFYHVVVTYGDGLMALYLNGELHSYRTLTGFIRTTSAPLLMGQMLPGETGFNFNGVIDDVRIWHGVLTPESVEVLYRDEVTAVQDGPREGTMTLNIYPNPAGAEVRVTAPVGLDVIRITDLSGKVMRQLAIGGSMESIIDVSGLPAGSYQLTGIGGKMIMTGQLVKM